jgi:hypothetical protein
MVYYIFRSIWPSTGTSKLLLKNAALLSMNLIQKYILFYAPIYYMKAFFGLFFINGNRTLLSSVFEALDDDQIFRNP